MIACVCRHKGCAYLVGSRISWGGKNAPNQQAEFANKTLGHAASYLINICCLAMY